MTAPKHLWSGDWRRDSDAAARELAERRTPREQPTHDQEQTPQPEPEPRPSALADARAWLRDASGRARQQLRTWRPTRTMVIALAVLVSAAAAFAIVWTTVGSGGSGSTAGVRAAGPSTTGKAWLGADTTDFAAAGGGALVTNVVPGGPADAAGLAPGDLITQIGNTPIASPSVIPFALASFHPGDAVEVQFQRGPFTNTAEVTLAAQPGSHP